MKKSKLPPAELEMLPTDSLSDSHPLPPKHPRPAELEMLPTDSLRLNNKQIIGLAGFIGLNIALFVLMVAFY